VSNSAQQKQLERGESCLGQCEQSQREQEQLGQNEGGASDGVCKAPRSNFHEIGQDVLRLRELLGGASDGVCEVPQSNFHEIGELVELLRWEWRSLQDHGHENGGDSYADIVWMLED
jgi:hypothetical protein